MKLREKRERLLVGLYYAAQARGVHAYYDLKEVADGIDLPRRPGELRAIANELRDTGDVRASFTLGGGDEGGMSVMPTAAGIEEAEELLDEHPDYGEASGDETGIPAADRYVQITDNQRARVVSHLEDLRTNIDASNEAAEEDKLIALSEIAAFEATFTQPRVSTDLVERFAKKVLTWILKVFGEALAATAAAAIIAELLPLVGGG